MLSTQAFNALLKTLEEPPSHAKFIFATTDIRKVPVTVLSRCQRFDLRRVEASVLAAYYGKIAGAEGVKVAPAALALIARAADGSVRDGLSLLDRALTLAEGEIGEQAVRDMLGLADRAQLFDLFDLLMKGEAAAALGLLGELYRSGADPALLLQDLLDLTHWLTRIKLVPETADDPAASEIERKRGRDLGRQALSAGPGPLLADAAEGAERNPGGTRASAGGRDGADPPDACFRHAPAGRTGEEADGRARRQQGPPAMPPRQAMAAAPSRPSAMAVGEGAARGQPAPSSPAGGLARRGEAARKFSRGDRACRSGRAI